MPPSQKDTFPRFNNGDVDIALTPVRRLKLHSDVLRDASRLFRRLLINENAAVLSKKALKEGNNIRWRIELINVPFGAEGIGQLPLDMHGNVINPQNLPRATMRFDGNTKDPANHIIDDWFAVLGAVYGCELDIGNRESTSDLSSLLDHADSIVEVTEYLEFNKPIFAPIELALLAQEQTLWRSVNKDPIQWMNLACRIRCFPVFREAAIHIIGAWTTWTEDEKAVLRPEVRELCKRKAEKFHEWKKAMETKLMDYRPKKLVFLPGMLPKGKKDHEPEVFIWEALMLFKDWLMRRIHEGMGYKARDGGYSLYKILAKGDDGYLPLLEQAKIAPLTAAGKAVIADHVRDIKKDVQRIVSPAMINELRLDITQWPAGKLSPFSLDSHHAPWANGRQPKPARRVPQVELHEDDEAEDKEDEE